LREALYLRTPLATAHFVDWWHLGGVQFMRRMDVAARHVWERLADPIEIPANQPIEALKTRGMCIAVVETGRIRIALPAEAPGPAPQPNPASPDHPPEPPKSPMILVGNAGDVFGTLPLGSARGYDKPIEPLEVQTLRDSRIWLASEDVFRGFLWKRGQWKLPTPLSMRWRDEEGSHASTGVGPHLKRHVRRHMVDGLAFVEGRLARGGLPISGLWARTRNSRAAAAMIELLDGAHQTYRSAIKVRERITAARFARWIGADTEWTSFWLDYAKSEGVLRRRFGTWYVAQQWRLHQWADAPMMEQTFELPPDPYDDVVEPDIEIGRPSRTAEGTTPKTESTVSD